MMDANSFMGLLSQAQGGSTPAAAAPMPTQDVSVPYDGGDPEMAAYARMGIDPELIRAKRWESIKNMATVLMGQGAGVDGSNLGQQLAAAGDSSRGLKDIMDLKSHASRESLERGKLSLLNQKLANEKAAEEREARMGLAGLSLISGLGGGGGAGGGASDLNALAGNGPMTIAQAAGVVPSDPAITGANPVTAPGTPGGGTVDTSGLPGQNGIPPIAQPRTPGDTLSAEQRAVASTPPIVATAVAAAQGDPKAGRALGMTPDMQKALMLQWMTDRKAATKTITELYMKPQYQSVRNSAGQIVLQDQYGDMKSVDAATMEDKLRLKSGESTIQEGREDRQSTTKYGRDQETAATAFERSRQKSQEDALRAEDIKNRETAMTVANKNVEGLKTSAEASKGTLEKTVLAEQLMREGVYSGSAANVAVGRAQAMLSQAGLWDNKMAVDANARTVALQNLGREVALGIAKSLKPASNLDVEFSQKIAGLAPESYDLPTMRKVLEISRRGHEQNIRDYNTAAERARKPYAIQGDERSRAAAEAAYPTIEAPAAPSNERRSIGGKTYENDGRGWFEVR